MSIKVRAYHQADVPEMIRLWNEVVEDGVAFPQETCLDEETGQEFFDAQTHCGVITMDGLDEGAVGDVRCACEPTSRRTPDVPCDAGDQGAVTSTRDQPRVQPLVGLYILHPNNVGRCGHIANASYAVDSRYRGLHLGEALVKDSLEQAKQHGFRILQFNAVVATNSHARHLYERLGFHPLGTIPGGFRLSDGHYEDICPYYRELD